ncbi:hypothetical protein NMY22_g463 [Coprinellus aureogranulatus]|nr:hypothetical protein NMY22_g463 [Coprinellus aureogranulatus]
MSAEPAPLTSASYIGQIQSVVEKYKDERDRIERMFDESPFLPDTLLSPLAAPSQTDEDNLKKKRQLYQWSTEGGYPPFLKNIPKDQQASLFQIFEADRIWDTTVGIPGEIWEFFSAFSDGNVTMDSIEKQYEDLHDTAVKTGQSGVYTDLNVGLRPDSDWYTDAVFAQQQLTGVNPTGLKQASQAWILAFSQAASDQKNTAAQQIISGSPSSLYVVDNSDYRHILGLAPDAPIVSPSIFGHPAYGCSSVSLFTLSDTGKLHPLAICLDYRGSIKQSVTIFNKRLTPDTTGVDEKNNWPWRFAKQCASTSDWLRHELSVHLTETHLLEEALIVAAQRNFPDSHIICHILRPHWLKTLSINFLARKTLVPVFINTIAPLQMDQIKGFVKQSYMNFDFTGRYVPNDLKARGFDPSTLDDKKFHNYLYARNISKCWDVIRTFVSDVLKAAYPNGDVDVLQDNYVAGFCAEMRSQAGGQLVSFPTHTAINYLQQYYLSFVPNRPASFAAPLPSTLDDLLDYTENTVIESLPISGLEDRTEWMFMAEVPYLLSAEVDPENSIEEYAESTKKDKDPRIAAAGPKFAKNIKALKALFDSYNEGLDDKVTKYHVLDPELIAQSILL